MTSRVRMCKAIQREVLDRIPAFEYVTDRKVVEHFCPGGEYADVVEELDLDGITACELSLGRLCKRSEYTNARRGVHQRMGRPPKSDHRDVGLSRGGRCLICIKSDLVN
jgi:hypothetical protein